MSVSSQIAPTAPPERDVAVAAGDRIYPLTRALAWSIVPFLLLGVYALYLRTDQTRQLWAWEIRAPMSALMLASAYAAGAYYFARAAIARRWHHIGRGLLPVLAFATLMAIVTIVHWPLFIHHNIAFTLWVMLYFVTPWLVAAAWWFNRREDTGRPDQSDVIIPDRVRRVCRVVGVVGLVGAGLLLCVPQPLIDIWAWPLTPLTARVLCVIFILFNVYLLTLSTDARWSAARLNVESLTVALVLIAVGTVRTYDTFVWSRPAAWVFPLVIAAALLACVLSLALIAPAHPVVPDGNAGSLPQGCTSLGSDRETLSGSRSRAPRRGGRRRPGRREACVGPSPSRSSP
jgi:hypothetical protein